MMNELLFKDNYIEDRKTQELTRLFTKSEIEPMEKNTKIKLAIIISALLVIIIIIILLVGHLKYDWFKSEIYDIDIEISRNKNQVDYFFEKKTIKTQVGFTNGEIENNELQIFTNFMILQTEAKEIEKNNFLITAILVILDVKINIEKEEKIITSFNILDKSVINELKNNPDGTKYPISVFSFYENGTIANIKLPNNMNNYNAYNIIDLIENIIPKLSRNRTEDRSNALIINTKTDKNKKILSENHSPREIKKFRGSKYIKSVERDIEDGQLKTIRTNSTLNLKTQTDNNKTDFGLKSFSCAQNSQINLIKESIEKENVELVKQISKYYTFINSEDLIYSLPDKYKEENEVKEEKKLAKNNDISATFELKDMNILGNDVSFKLYFGVYGDKGDKFSAGFTININDLDIHFGTDGAYYDFSHEYKDVPLFKFTFPSTPAVSIALKAGGKISFHIGKYNTDPVFRISISGSIDANAEIKAGWDLFASITASAKGTVISASGSGNCDKDGDMYFTGKIGSGPVIVSLEGKALDNTIFDYDYQIWEGWSISK